MTTLDAETLKKEMIDIFELILELNKSPKMLDKLPKKSTVVKQGDKWMFIPTKKDAKVLLL